MSTVLMPWIKSYKGPTSGGGPFSFITGQGLTTLRSDADLPVGFKFTVGGSNITVTDLGRWIVSGNSGSHSMRITDSVGADVAGPLALDTTGGTVGTYKFVTLGTPVVLTASTVYYCFSNEANLGDQWYEGDTTVTATGVATVDASAYLNAGTPTIGTAGSYSYGPVNFKYT